MSHLITLPLLCFGPIQFYSKLILANTCVDVHEQYRKQTWRNRFQLVGANGLQDVSIPVEKPANHALMNEVVISYKEDWQRKHWRTLVSAYARSPFFEFYSPELQTFFEARKFETLVDFNTAALQLTCRWLKCEMPAFTATYQEATSPDFRELLSPKNTSTTDRTFSAVRYPQVFEDRHGFLPNLSVLDVLFCMGPQAREIILQSRINVE